MLDANTAQSVPVPQDAAIVPVDPVGVIIPEPTVPTSLHIDSNTGNDKLRPEFLPCASLTLHSTARSQVVTVRTSNSRS